MAGRDVAWDRIGSGPPVVFCHGTPFSSRVWAHREIAARLVVSTRTIDAHLRNTFAKLGVRSRVELARAADVTYQSATAAGSGS